jgi:hypothetical protein
MSQTRPEELGQAALTGWRKTVADRAAPAVSKKAPVSEDQARALIGAAFFLLSAYYVAGTLARIAKRARG